MANLKRYFVSGVLVVVPIILTYLVLKLLFDAADGILQPLILKVFGYSIPGLGVVITLLLIILAGVLTRNIVGARIYSIGDRLLARLPIIRPIYSAAKQLLEAVTSPSLEIFKEVGLIEYPRTGIYSVVLISRQHDLEIDGAKGKYACCFVPSTPTPITGWTVVVPIEDVHILDMTIEEAVKFLVSGGVASRNLLKSSMKLSQRTESEATSEAG